MSVRVVFPSVSAERAKTATNRWRAQGYEVAIWAEEGFDAPGNAIVHFGKSYPGYWAAVNFLARASIADGASLVVLIGDDMDPDPAKRADKIEREFFARFPNGFGVMQPIGSGEPGVDRICGSPWLGPAWVLMAYRGCGPLWPEYNQFFGDQELHDVAASLGVLWQRKDLAHQHHHWMLPGGPKKTDYQVRNDKHWKHDEDIFRRRKRDGWPCSEPLTVIP